jgi:tricorn protease
MRKFLMPVVLLAGWVCGASADSAPPLLLQKPTLSKTHIAFVYAGDLWTVPREGGEARHLTNGPGREDNPVSLRMAARSPSRPSRG